MNDYYYMLVIKPSSHLELFSDFLVDLLPVGFEEIDDGFVVRSEESLETVLWGVEQFAEALQKALGEVIDIDCVLTKEKNDDWIAQYQNAIQPVQVDPFYIHPTWETPLEGMLNIAIDPALAFGTGHHPTTASCLRAIGKHVHSGNEVMDVGCGSGICYRNNDTINLINKLNHLIKLLVSTDIFTVTQVELEPKILTKERFNNRFARICKNNSENPVRSSNFESYKFVHDLPLWINGCNCSPLTKLLGN